VGGVGALTAVSFVLVLEDPSRFEKSRAVGAYLGLVPGKDQSGESDPQQRISKEGDEMLRRLLVGSAHYILGPFGSDSDLRRHGQQIASRAGKNAKKRAAVAVARKLATRRRTV
jgi:transposase